jgi:segregation and condensation protein B
MSAMSDENSVGPVLLAVIEGLLFVTDRPLGVADICAALSAEEVTAEVVEAAVTLLLDRHSAGADEGRGFTLVAVGDAWQFRTAREVTPWLAAFTGMRPVRLSRAALETLAIVAYRQPCTRAEIEAVRGVDCGGVLRALLDRRLLRLAGRRNDPGRPNVYASTQEFLDVFGLTSIREMPNLREFTMLGEEDIEAVSALFGEDAESQMTMEEFAQRRAIGGEGGPTPGLEPVPGEEVGPGAPLTDEHGQDSPAPTHSEPTRPDGEVS